MDLKGEVHAVCQGILGMHAVLDEILSDALEAVWDNDPIPPEVRAWISDVVRKSLATNARRDRRRAARRVPLEVIEAGNQHAAGKSIHHRDPVADVAYANELRTVITRDDFEREAVAASLREHAEYRDFGEFARSQTYCSKANAYKRREGIRQHLRERCTA